MKLTARAAIVTGATLGIGLAVAEGLIAKGMRVAGLARDAERLKRVAGRLGQEFLPLACDVGRLDQVERAIRTARGAFGTIDVLVNNAGIGRFGAVDELAKESWDEMLATNVSGPYHCARLVVPIMKAQGQGHIVNIASIAGKVGYPNASAYNASKFALRGMGEALAAELGQFGIKVSTLFPGTTDTTFGFGSPGPGAPSMRPEDVAKAIVYFLEQDVLVAEMVLRPLPIGGEQ